MEFRVFMEHAAVSTIYFQNSLILSTNLHLLALCPPSLYSRTVRCVELYSPVFSEFCYQVLQVYSRVASVCNVVLLRSSPW